jgi:SsrA-binding protein
MIVSMKIFCTNRKAKFDYTVLETFEAGIVLKGSEVKSIVAHHCSLDGAYAQIIQNEIFLLGCNIDQFKQSGPFNNHEPKRQRKLLLHKQQILKLSEMVKAKGNTLIPLSIYQSEESVGVNKIKIKLGVCKGKQTHDKRQALKEKDLKKRISNHE